MPNTKSAKKALRSSLRKREINLKYKWTLKSALKDFRKSLNDSQESASKKLSEVYSAFDKAVKKNIVNKGNASRKKSRLYDKLAKTFGIERIPKTKEERKAAKPAKEVSPKKAAPKAKKEVAKKTTTKAKTTKVKKEAK